MQPPALININRSRSSWRSSGLRYSSPAPASGLVTLRLYA